jgi:hypothetical protein
MPSRLYGITTALLATAVLTAALIPNGSLAQSGANVDILFVDDNASAMGVNYPQLGSKFDSLFSAVSGLNWQIGIVTTDCDADQWSFCGELLTLSGQGTTYVGGADILTASTPNYVTVFNNTMVRPETTNCQSSSNGCPGGFTPLQAADTAMAKYNSATNSGFFRDGSDLVVVIVTNKDEDNLRPMPMSTTPQQVIARFNSIWGTTGKKLTVYSIVLLPGDTVCQQAQAKLGTVSPGTYPITLTALTGGLAVSICASDYGAVVNQIGQSIKDRK